jgi:hypothetical protein
MFWKENSHMKMNNRNFTNHYRGYSASKFTNTIKHSDLERGEDEMAMAYFKVLLWKRRKRLETTKPQSEQPVTRHTFGPVHPKHKSDMLLL